VSPIEDNPITLTLDRFWEVPPGARVLDDLIPIDGVTVCVLQKRAVGEGPDAFVPVEDVPCVVTVGDEKPVLDGVPASSQVILTASKAGLVPRAITVTTGLWNQDASGLSEAMTLMRPETLLGLDANADLELGAVVALAVRGLDALLGDVEIGLEPGARTPTYFSEGVVTPDAGATASGTLRSFTGVLFTNLDPGEYDVTFQRTDTWCEAIYFGGYSIHGFKDDDPNVVRAVVLPRHVTQVAAECDCIVLDDARTCTPAP
jgi:hypothetical protein